MVTIPVWMFAVLCACTGLVVKQAITHLGWAILAFFFGEE
jgi:hypothetical protein